jgi:hypothetical protein
MIGYWHGRLQQRKSSEERAKIVEASVEQAIYGV